MALTKAHNRMITGAQVNVLDYGADPTGAVDSTSAIQAAIDASLVPSVNYSTVFFPVGIYTISSPLLLPANHSLDGDNAIIKALSGFSGVTRNNTGAGGTTVLDSLLLFLLGDYNDIGGAQRDNAFVGRGITLDCNEVTTSGIYIERMPYSTIQCKVINTIAGGNAINIGPYCWGVHLDSVTVENFSENAISLGEGANGITITSPRIWGKNKTGVTGILLQDLANVNGLAIVGGFIEKINFGLYVGRSNGPVSVSGTDFEVCTNNCITVIGHSGDTHQATVGIRNCYFSSVGSNVYAAYSQVSVNGCRLRSGNNFETGTSGFIEALNNHYESVSPTIVASSNVAVDVEQSWTPTLLDDSLSPSEGQTYSVASGTYSRSANKVFFKGIMTLTSIGTLGTGESARIGGLPFSSSSTANTQSVINIGFGTGLSLPAVNAVSGYIGVGSDYATLQKFSATTGSSNMTVSEVSASGTLIFSGWYTI